MWQIQLFGKFKEIEIIVKVLQNTSNTTKDFIFVIFVLNQITSKGRGGI